MRDVHLSNLVIGASGSSSKPALEENDLMWLLRRARRQQPTAPDLASRAVSDEQGVG